MKEKEFNLSEKIWLGNEYNISIHEDFVKVKDIKEFIKRLKEELMPFLINSNVQVKETYQIIDKLAGEKLSKG